MAPVEARRGICAARFQHRRESEHRRDLAQQWGGLHGSDKQSRKGTERSVGRHDQRCRKRQRDREIKAPRVVEATQGADCHRRPVRLDEAYRVQGIPFGGTDKRPLPRPAADEPGH